MEELNTFHRICPISQTACRRGLCEHQCYMEEKEARESKECPVTTLTCRNPLCAAREGHCELHKNPWEQKKFIKDLILEMKHDEPSHTPTPIVIHIHNDFGPLLEVLLSINQKLNQMPTKADFDAFVASINQSTSDLGSSLDNIATDITTLTDKLVTGGLTPDETTAVLAEFSGVADKVKSLADAAKSIADRTPGA